MLSVHIRTIYTVENVAFSCISVESSNYHRRIADCGRIKTPDNIQPIHSLFSVSWDTYSQRAGESNGVYRSFHCPRRECCIFRNVLLLKDQGPMGFIITPGSRESFSSEPFRPKANPVLNLSVTL